MKPQQITSKQQARFEFHDIQEGCIILDLKLEQIRAENLEIFDVKSDIANQIWNSGNSGSMHYFRSEITANLTKSAQKIWKYLM